MIYGYIDESGSPGVANNSNDYLLASLVIFSSEKNRDASVIKIDRLCKKLSLPDNYEFHCSSNSTRPQAEFYNLLALLNFRFITVAIRKNDFRKTASYSRLSALLIAEIEKHFSEITIEMDSNPTFYAALRKQTRARNLRGVKIRERSSRSNRLIQVADYVANISSKHLKYTAKGQTLYAKIAKKVVSVVLVTD